MAKRALGRGINALFQATEVREPGEVLSEIDLDLLEPSADQPRTVFRERQLDELAASIRANGIVQPLLARRRGDRYQIIAGERRWRAAQRAGLTKVPVVVRDIPDERVLELSLIENIQREELNPIEEANAYRRLIEGLGITQEEVAQRVGRDRSSVTNYLRLLKLPEELQQWVEEDRLSMGHARAILGLDSPEAQRNLAIEVIARRLSVRETERAVKRLLAETVKRVGGTDSTAGRASALSSDANQRAAEEKLSRRLGTKVRITPMKIGGKIEIVFYSDAELDNIYSLIMGA
ncbi:MAG: ParB/RepB/Spo0J family partition protein [Acidobacteria bacterium]|nr:ParB/RepB/Spo0J family partition protein [Acidobacteriota bacterium]